MKKMKKITLIIVLILLKFVLYSQNNQGKADDAGRIALAAVVPDQIEGITPSAQSNLLNKLNQIAVKNGIGGSVFNNRFILTTNISVITKDITPSAPPMHAYTLEVSLYIGDGIDGTLFASTSVTLKGVGQSETKAYISAIQNLKVDDSKYKSFIETGKNKIIEYYNSRCDFILKEAEALANQNQYDAAIFNLIGIPEVCKECYEKALNAIPPIYQKKIDRECKMKLQEANSIWNANQDINSAQSAGAILSTIEPSSACFKEVQDLNKRISEKVKQIDNREWNFKLKEQTQESERIKAYRDIGVAYGNGQPKNITYKTLW
jgi:hypothetical protein